MQPLPTRLQVINGLLQKWKPGFQKETVATDEALDRVLVDDVYSEISVPVVRASGMDGIGVRSELFINGIPDTRTWKLGEDFCRADTGDDFDDKFDAVIPIEQVSISAGGMLIIAPNAKVEAGFNIRPRGSTIKNGDLLARKNRRLRSFDLGCLAIGGISKVEVYKRPRVAFIPTGNELVPLGTPLKRGNNIDSNSILAKHMLREIGADPICFPIVRDDRAVAGKALEEALLQADIVILNGGSSKGEEDYNAQLLEERGMTLFHWVAAAPGKPMCVALIDNKPVINIPGPPLAVLYGFDWCIRAIVNHLLHLPSPRRQTIKGVLAENINTPSNMEILCMMEVQKTKDEYIVKQKPWRGGNVANSLGAGAIYVTKPGRTECKAGEVIEVELLRGEEEL